MTTAKSPVYCQHCRCNEQLTATLFLCCDVLFYKTCDSFLGAASGERTFISVCPVGGFVCCRAKSSSLHGNKPFRSVFGTWGSGDKTDDLWGCVVKTYLHCTDRVHHCTFSSSYEYFKPLLIVNLMKQHENKQFILVYIKYAFNKTLTMSRIEVKHCYWSSNKCYFNMYMQ